MKEIKVTLKLFCLLFIMCGFIYPIITLSAGHLFFRNQADGSLIKQKDQIIGSTLIGQPFTSPQYLHPRPSYSNYNPLYSGGSNSDIYSARYQQVLNYRILIVQKENDRSQPVPIDLITASGSGLDPDVSMMSALYQVNRIAHARHTSVENIMKLIKKEEIKPILGLFGEPRINVIKFNLALDANFPKKPI